LRFSANFTFSRLGKNSLIAGSAATALQIQRRDIGPDMGSGGGSDAARLGVWVQASPKDQRAEINNKARRGL